MAFRKKAEFILKLKPDVLIVPECEHLDKLKYEDDTIMPTNTLWFGTNQNKGLGIFSYGSFKLKLIKTHNPDLRMIVPIAVTGGYKFTLYAIWANNPADPDGQYVEQVWKALNHYENGIKSNRTMLAGDFNSNTIWDKKRRLSNHSNVVKRLEEKGIYSSYHLHHKQIQGKEKHPTFYMSRHRNKPYHIDYCFISLDMVVKLKSVKIGNYDFWSQYSDHSPFIVDFDI
jgi:exonuclease III